MSGIRRLVKIIYHVEFCFRITLFQIRRFAIYWYIAQTRSEFKFGLFFFSLDWRLGSNSPSTLTNLLILSLHQIRLLLMWLKIIANSGPTHVQSLRWLMPRLQRSQYGRDVERFLSSPYLLCWRNEGILRDRMFLQKWQLWKVRVGFIQLYEVLLTHAVHCQIHIYAIHDLHWWLNKVLYRFKCNVDVYTV